MAPSKARNDSDAAVLAGPTPRLRSSLAGVLQPLGRRDPDLAAALAHEAAAVRGGLVARYEAVDVLPLEDLLVEQRVGEALEQGAVLGEQRQGAPVGEVRDVLLLLFDHAPGRVRHRVVVGRQLLGLELRAHAVFGDHLAAY